MLFIFDMGGVVTTTFEMDSLYSKIGITKEDFFRICREGQSNIWHQLETGKITSAQFWTDFNEKIKGTTVKPVEHDLFRLYFHPVLNIETVKLIKELRKNHRVVCGTNTIQSHWENHMERGDYSFFDQTYASNKIGEAKPDPAFYKLILEAENVKPEEAYFTDDRLDNIKGALSVGINAVQFTTAKELRSQWKKI